MLIETRPLAELAPDRAAQRHRLLGQAWPQTDDAGTGGSDADHDPALRPISMLLVEDELVLASLDILSKELNHRGRRYRASGLSAVVTDERSRHRGYGQALVKAARLSMQNRGRDLALFTCDTYLTQFYLDAGFAVLPGAVVVGGTPEDPLRSDAFNKVTLGAFYTTLAAAHAEDFTQCDIELYPGQIDRLW